MKFWFGTPGWGWRLWGVSYGDRWFFGLSIKQGASGGRLLAQQPATDRDIEAEPQPGWYCAHCQRGVDAREVTYSEQHEVCGRYIANDDPPRPRAPVGAAPPEEMQMSAEYYHTLIEKGGKVIGCGNVITENDWQIMGHENNRAICPPEEKWIGYKTIPFPHPTFVRMPPNT